VLLLIWLTRREGIRLRDLVGRGRNIALDVLWGPLLAIPLLILFSLANALAALIVYGPLAFTASSASASTVINTYGVPVWVFWWSAIILPFSAGIAEELTYRGYALPRFVALNVR
jgi:membrane protease YdiL (CAAX protease family)